MTAGIQNTIEVLDLVRHAFVAYHSAKQDGSISWIDLLDPETRALLPKLKDALADGHLIAGELSDLDSSEVTELYTRMSDIVLEVISLLSGAEG